MGYGTPKTLPVTGAGVFAVGSITNQILVVAGIMLVVYLVALGVRYLFRRNKTIDKE